MDKHALLNKLYFDPSGFQSQQRLYKEAKLKDKTITMKDVKEWYSQNVEKTRYYGTNSFVAPHAHYEYQIDLFFITDLDNQQYKTGMACIDIFSKYATIVPIKSKQSSDFLAGLMECLTNMKHKPKFIYSDNEGSLNSKDVLGFLEKQKIDVGSGAPSLGGSAPYVITTRNHAHFVERFIRTFKSMLRKRINDDIKQGKDNIQWHNYIFPIMLTYNNKYEHSATGLTPTEATKEDNAIEAKINMLMKAKRNRAYPDLAIGDRVKIMLKYDKLNKKEHMPKYSDLKYEIEKIQEKHGLKLYTVNNRERLRNELLLVNT